MKTHNVVLEELHEHNWYECCQLEVAENQTNHIEPNAVSIAQSKFEPSLRTFAIKYEEKTVGFFMFNTVEEELGGHWIYRIMVDKQYQGRGIGKRAMQLIIEEIATLPQAKRIVVGYHPGNTGAHQLYASVGFVDHGNRFGKEMAVVLDL
ncbi:GNAT family N-acetyltransferase [Priestia taiwanensis]|uniref:Spermidine acetyltransferase n=1 Tax=Priestia taiwanensis TaxID=1347902 RepID=A0A917ETJ6_9BACI|nr:GNAT family N-acetyltransferase [Priestia taiwanensis]MBM7364727.1 diamine N-acetyltransferase [Priestia taiwanensis]GGE79154.1 spermidine acetyltransferase [Priestia taiwanensis]